METLGFRQLQNHLHFPGVPSLTASSLARAVSFVPANDHIYLAQSETAGAGGRKTLQIFSDFVADTTKDRKPFHFGALERGGILKTLKHRGKSLRTNVC
jgi:hypothetical protein